MLKKNIVSILKPKKKGRERKEEKRVKMEYKPVFKNAPGFPYRSVAASENPSV